MGLIPALLLLFQIGTVSQNETAKPRAQISVFWSVAPKEEPYLPCATTVPGSHEVFSVAYWLHENPTAQRWRDESPILITPPSDSVLGIFSTAEGYPVAVFFYARPAGGLWRALFPADFELIRQCGFVPPQFPWIFANDFEEGDLSKWGRVVQ